MRDYKGVHVDIGGPLRVSDEEMFGAESSAFEGVYNSDLGIFFTPIEAWQLYGIMSKEGYEGFFKAALAIIGTGTKYSEMLREDDPISTLRGLIKEFEDGDLFDRVALEHAAKKAKDIYMANQSKRLAEGAREGLDLMKDNGVGLSIITSIVTPDAIRWVKEMGLSEYFRDGLVMGNSPEGAVKKDEKTPNILRASEVMGLSPEDTLYVADSRGDMQASQEAGCSVAMIRKGMTPPSLFGNYLQEMPSFELGRNYYEVDDLKEAAEMVIQK